MNERAAFIKYLCGNMDAVEFCDAVFRVSQVWDDLIDRDVPVSNEAIDGAFWRCLIEIPRNPFYRQNIDFLQPLLQSAIIDWLDSRTLETGSDHEKDIAFVLRDSISSLLIHCAGLTGGKDWMMAVSPEIRRLVFNEPRNAYKAGI